MSSFAITGIHGKGSRAAHGHWHQRSGVEFCSKFRIYGCAQIRRLCENVLVLYLFQLTYSRTVRSELACHVDGHIATAAHTLVLPSEPEKNEPTEGHVADAYCAAYYARELLLCALRPGVEAADLATLITAVARCFHVQPVAHHPIVTQMQRFLPEVEAKQVILDEEGTLISPDFQVEAGDVFCIHVLMTTHPNGSRLRESDSHRPTLIQRNVLNTYPLKMQAARQALQTITQVGGVFPVHVRTLGALRERLGLNELVQHALVDWLPVWRAGKPGRDVVTQFKGTAIVQDDLTWQYTGGVKTLSYVHSMHALSPELQSMWDGLRKEVGELVSESEQMTMMDQMEC